MPRKPRRQPRPEAPREGAPYDASHEAQVAEPRAGRAQAAAAQAQAGIGQAVETAKTMSQTRAGRSNLLDGVLKAALSAGRG